MSNSTNQRSMQIGSFRARRDAAGSWRRGRVQVLRDQVERHVYAVDATDVAESIIDAAMELRPTGSGLR